jgi:hypothetical protein
LERFCWMVFAYCSLHSALCLQKFRLPAGA